MKLGRAAVVICLGLTGCTPRPSGSLEDLYTETKTQLKEGRLQEALASANAGFRQEPSWRFRLLKAEVLLALDPRKALEILDSTESPTSAELGARVSLVQGHGRYLIADYAQAEIALNHARDLASTLQLPLLDAEIDLDRGTLRALQGDATAADENFRAALFLATQHNDPTLQVKAMGSLGWLLLLTHHPDDAVYWLEKQRTAAEQLGLKRSLANAVGNLGSCYYRLGDFDQALAYFREAEEAFRKSGERREQQVWLGNIGNVLLERGDGSQAREPYEKALAIARDLGEKSWIATWLSNLATVSFNLRDFDIAERYNHEALDLKRDLKQKSIAYPRLNEARIAAGRNDYARAEGLFRALLAEPSEDPTPALEAQSGLAELLIASKQFERADAQYHSTIATLEHQSSVLARDEYKLSYLSSLIKFYQNYVDFLVTRGEKEKALEVAESSRARVLDERLRRAGKNGRSVSAASLRKIAGSSGSTLLSYWLAPTRSFLWVITPAGVELHILPPEKQIAALVDSYRSQLEQLRDPLESELPAGKKLSEILAGPLRPLLATGARMILVPDRALHSLNLETLPDPEDPSRYLIERVTLSIAPSLGLLAEARRPAHQQPSILLIGDPETAVEEYPRLPYAAKEMSMIGQSFPADRRVVAEGAQAYPAAYRESDPARFSWIHFAAHATANRENPLDSALILSRHDSAYALTARDVMNVPLHADLVTLSACRSAGARTYSGEGLVGLSWAFLRAGAGSVVAGLWDVTDMSTATLMADFYEQLLKNVPPAEALRRAKLRLVHSGGAYKKPFYWGPFQLYAGSI